MYTLVGIIGEIASNQDHGARTPSRRTKHYKVIQ